MIPNPVVTPGRPVSAPHPAQVPANPVAPRAKLKRSGPLETFPDPTAAALPQLSQLPARFLAWKRHDDEPGRKPPTGEEGRKLEAWQEPPYLTLDEARKVASKIGGGIGFVLVLGEGYAALDLDGCFQEDGGTPVSDDAKKIVDLVTSAGCYTDTSPSGRGLRALFRGPRSLEVSFKHSPPQVSSLGLFVTLTGTAAEGDPTKELPGLADAVLGLLGQEPQEKPKDRTRTAALPEDGAPIRPGHQDVWLRNRAWMHACRGLQYEDVLAQLRVDVLRCPDEPGREPWGERDLEDLARRAVEKAPEEKLLAGDDGKISKSPENIRRAFRIVQTRPRLDRFSNRRIVETGDGKRVPLDDEMMLRLWLGFDDGLKFRPDKSLFSDVVHLMAATDDFHPVRDYLDSLTWDGTPRAERWLVTYGKAADTEYVRAVGLLFLVAAVRRIRRPGSKFDELVVLESEQGLDKSNAVQALCPKGEWFSQTLTLDKSSKETIEHTTGVWIAEAAEMVGSKRDVDHLKAFLSTQADQAAAVRGHRNH